MKTRRQMRQKRANAYRNKLRGTLVRPRLTITRSNTRLSVQLIDDNSAKTLGYLCSTGKNIVSANVLGKDLVAFMKAKKITTVVFDRSGHRYHGAIKALADALREGGILV